jgi:hypothetical protein
MVLAQVAVRPERAVPGLARAVPVRGAAGPERAAAVL